MEQCPVCMEDFKERLSVTIPCGTIHHKICMRCFIHLRKRECPMCRKNFEHLIPDIEDDTRMNLVEFLRSSDSGN